MNHLHRYERHKTRKDIYKCVHPECTHYNSADMIVGKKAECSKCGNPMIIDKIQALRYKNKHLTCLDCSNSKQAKKHRAAKDVIAKILAGIKKEDINREVQI